MTGKCEHGYQTDDCPDCGGPRGGAATIIVGVFAAAGILAAAFAIAWWLA